LAGVKNATSGQLMDSMYSSWNLDPVHGEKVAYTRIGLSLLDIIKQDLPREPRDSLGPRKRSREDDSPPSRSREEARGRYDQDRTSYRREDSTTSRMSRSSSAYTVYPGDFDRRRDSPSSPRGGRGRYNH
jgi:hypothetical protein